MSRPTAPLVVIGDTLLDRDIDGEANRLMPDAAAPVLDVSGEISRPGGAGLAAMLAVAVAPGGRADRDVVLVTALGQEDPVSRMVRSTLADRVRLVELPLHGSLPVKTRIRAGGRPLVRLDSGGGTVGEPDPSLRTLLRSAAAVLVSDYGRGVAEVARPLLADGAADVPVLWDPHPRGAVPVPGAQLVTPNAAEARSFAAALPGMPKPADGSLRADSQRAAALGRHWNVAAVAITLGDRGAILARGDGVPMVVPAPRSVDGDTCGAGDSLAVTTLVALAGGALPEEALQAGVDGATVFIASGGVGNPDLWRPVTARSDRAAWNGRGTDGAERLAARVRTAGGVVVATGGCFDLLHAGHVGMLDRARRLGDCLIVCLNSDASVRRLKGPGRPFNPVEDRSRVLLGLGSVDAVAVFDEVTPHRVLRDLRPHIWVKGGDYSAEALPETATLASWGGLAVVLPYLPGYSTSALAARIAG